jgi:hypothetical protein
VTTMWPSRNANSAEGHSLSAALIMSDPTVAMSNSPATQRCALSLVVVIVGESSGRQDSNLKGPQVGRRSLANPTGRSSAVARRLRQVLPAAGRGRPLDDPSSRVYRVLERLRRFVIRVDARVICVVSRVLSVDARGNWG